MNVLERLSDEQVDRLIDALTTDDTEVFLREIGDAGDVGEDFLVALLELRELRATHSPVAPPRVTDADGTRRIWNRGERRRFAYFWRWPVRLRCHRNLSPCQYVDDPNDNHRHRIRTGRWL